MSADRLTDDRLEQLLFQRHPAGCRCPDGDQHEFDTIVAELSRLRTSIPGTTETGTREPYYLADGSEVLLPKEEVERRRRAAAKALGLARTLVEAGHGSIEHPDPMLDPPLVVEAKLALVAALGPALPVSRGATETGTRPSREEIVSMLTACVEWEDVLMVRQAIRAGVTLPWSAPRIYRVEDCVPHTASALPVSRGEATGRECLWHADCDAADRALRPGVSPSHPPLRASPSPGS